MSSPSVKINQLNPYAPDFTFSALVSEKSNIRTWNLPKSSGKMFDAVLVDETAEVKAMWFNDDVDRDFSQLQIGHCYQFSGFNVKMTNKKFSSIDNDYELTAKPATKILEISDSSVCEILRSAPRKSKMTTSISNISLEGSSDTVNVLGIVLKVGQVVQVQTKTSPIAKRVILLVDHTNIPIQVTLWREEAEGFFSEPRSAILITKLRLVDLGTRKVYSTSSQSRIETRPELERLEQGQILQAWFEAQTDDSWNKLLQSTSSIIM